MIIIPLMLFISPNFRLESSTTPEAPMCRLWRVLAHQSSKTSEAPMCRLGRVLTHLEQLHSNRPADVHPTTLVSRPLAASRQGTCPQHSLASSVLPAHCLRQQGVRAQPFPLALWTA